MRGGVVKMSRSANFRKQLGAVMEILTKAAVAEIVKLVDDGSAYLRLEMYRAQSENQALKTKVLEMEGELEAALRRPGGDPAARPSPADRRSVGVQVCGEHEELRDEKNFENGFGTEVCISVWREEAVTRGETRDLLPPFPLTEKSSGVQEETFQCSVKQEAPEEGLWSSDLEKGPETSQKEATEMLLQDDRKALQATPARGSEVLGEEWQRPGDDQRRGGRSRAESWHRCVAPTITCTQYEHAVGRPNFLVPEHAPADAARAGWASFPPRSCAKSNGPPQKFHGVLVPAELGRSLSSSVARNSVGTQPGSGKEPTYSEKRGDLTLQRRPQQRHGSSTTQGGRGDTVGSGRVLNGTAHDGVGLTLSGTGLNVNRIMKTCRKPCAEEKPFKCPHCGRTFSRLTCLKIHQRSHTGEKPYSCSECGRQFTQQKSLKTHLSVHTGERPFSCKLCGKRFSRQDNCTRHERFHSGKKPFSCKQCGKCFTLQSNLKTHQQIHCGVTRLLCA